VQWLKKATTRRIFSVRKVNLSVPKRVFNIDISIREACGGAVKIIASIEDPAVIKQILTHLQRKAEPKEFNPLPGSRAPPQIGLFG
jgi:hypothetical protein